MIVRTPRLVLRRWTDDDVAPYAALCADAEVMRYVGDGSTMTHEEAVAQIERFEQGFESHGYGLWAVQTADSGAFIGFAGLSQPLFLPEILPAVEVGWRFAREYWGQGLATETGRAALRHGFDTVGLERIVGIAHPDNAASLGAMRRLGMTLDRETTHPTLGVPLRVLAITRPQHDAAGWAPSSPLGSS